jgi:hypothetical protein
VNKLQLQIMQLWQPCKQKPTSDAAIDCLLWATRNVPAKASCMLGGCWC